MYNFADFPLNRPIGIQAKLEVPPLQPKPRSEAAYLPICLYSDLARNKKSLIGAISKIFKIYHKVLIVIADDLHAITKMNRGYRKETALKGARIFSNNLSKIIENEFSNEISSGKICILFWRQLQGEKGFRDIQRIIIEQYEGNWLFRKVCDDFCRYSIRKISLPYSKFVFDNELRYLFEEICGSIFSTEILGYAHEIWERIPASGNLDPIKFIYTALNEKLKEALFKAELRRICLTLDTVGFSEEKD